MNVVTDSYLNYANRAETAKKATRVSVGKEARRITKITENFKGILESNQAQSYNVGTLSAIVRRLYERDGTYDLES